MNGSSPNSRGRQVQNSTPNSTSTPSFMTTQPQDSSPPSSTPRVVEEPPPNNHGHGAGTDRPSISAKNLLPAPCNAGVNGPNNMKFPPPRRSSVVVIPPMQVCPGDLLVYSKALTHRGNLQGRGKYCCECGNAPYFLKLFLHLVLQSSTARRRVWRMSKVSDSLSSPCSGLSTGGLSLALFSLQSIGKIPWDKRRRKKASLVSFRSFFLPFSSFFFGTKKCAFDIDHLFVFMTHLSAQEKEKAAAALAFFSISGKILGKNGNQELEADRAKIQKCGNPSY